MLCGYELLIGRLSNKQGDRFVCESKWLPIDSATQWQGVVGATIPQRLHRGADRRPHRASSAGGRADIGIRGPAAAAWPALAPLSRTIARPSSGSLDAAVAGRYGRAGPRTQTAFAALCAMSLMPAQVLPRRLRARRSTIWRDRA